MTSPGDAPGTARAPGADDRAALQMVGREGILVAGGARAILLQVAHPGVGAGVADHSDFAYRPMDRLRTTLTYVYAVTFGTPAEAKRVSDLVTRVHTKVVGPGYDAQDPHLQLWVAATLYDTADLLYGLIFGRPDPLTAERVYEQYALLGTALQVPESLWPASRREFRRYFDDMVSSVEVSEGAKRVAHDLMWPVHAPLAIRAGAPLNRLLTAAWLPERLRTEYGLAWDSRRERAYRAVMAVGRATYPHLPARLREAPKDRYLADLRRRMSGGRRVIGSAATTGRSGG